MRPESTLVYPRPVPHNDTGFFEGIMIDDRVGVQVVDCVERRAPKPDRLRSLESVGDFMHMSRTRFQNEPSNETLPNNTSIFMGVLWQSRQSGRENVGVSGRLPLLQR